MIDFSQKTDAELHKWNDQMRSQINYAKKGWLSEMLELWQSIHEKVIVEMNKRGLTYTIKFEKK